MAALDGAQTRIFRKLRWVEFSIEMIPFIVWVFPVPAIKLNKIGQKNIYNTYAVLEWGENRLASLSTHRSGLGTGSCWIWPYVVLRIGSSAGLSCRWLRGAWGLSSVVGLKGSMEFSRSRFARVLGVVAFLGLIEGWECTWRLDRTRQIEWFWTLLFWWT